MDKLTKTIVNAMQDKKARDIVSLDLSKFDGAICDTFVICDAASTTQVEAITNGIEQMVEKELGEKVWRIEGLGNSVWVVMDYGNVMVHVFQTELRDFYKLEKLWGDAPATHYKSEE